MDRIKYIRTDKNGTKIFEDWTCPRCGGEGWAGQWKFTGVTCFRCGGSGLRNRPVIVKEYTDEYAAKLEARRAAREAKHAEDHADEIAAAAEEQKRREAEWVKEMTERACKTVGCGADGIGYVLTGDTYRVKEQIKAHGGKWISQSWVCPVEFKAKDVKAVRIDISGYFGKGGNAVESYARDLVFCVGVRGMDFETAKATVAEWREEGC